MLRKLFFIFQRPVPFFKNTEKKFKALFFALLLSHSHVLFAQQAVVTEQALPKITLTPQIIFQVLAAEIALQRGALGPAYKTYLALANNIKDPRTAERAVEIAIQGKDLNSALAAAQIWYNLSPEWQPAIETFTRLLVETQHFSEAKVLLEKQLAKTPDAQRGQAILEIQNMLSRYSKTNPAAIVSLLQSIITDKDKSRKETYWAIARVQLLANDSAQAMKAIKQALLLDPNDETAALLATQVGGPAQQEAIILLKNFVAQHPKAKAIRMGYADLLLKEKNFHKAQEEFNSIYRLDPHDLTTLLALGILNMRSRQDKVAQTFFQKYIEEADKQDIDATPAYFSLAQLAETRKDWKLAEHWLTRITASNPQYLSAQIARAQLLAEQNKVNRAMELLEKLLKENANNLEARQIIIGAEAKILIDAEQYSKAKILIEKALQNEPQSVDLLYLKGILAELTGNYASMETIMRKLMVEDPENPDAYNTLGYSLANRNIRLDEAQSLIKQALSIAPDAPYILDSLGWVKFRMGKPQEALVILEQAYQKDPKAEVAAHLGETLWQLERQEEAKKYWREGFLIDAEDKVLLNTMQRYHFSPKK